MQRRELLVAISTVAAFFGLPGAGLASAEAIDSGAFRELTGTLTGISPSDPTLPQLFLQAFAEDIDKLAKLHAIVTQMPEAEWDSAIVSAGLKPLSESLIQAWYTGSITQGADERVLTYLDAFVWSACGYTKPPTRCDTNFGAWADPPPPGRFSE
ncbi:MAG: sugar dehydrogenase complex small subunit [Rhizobiaceae bacterium]